MIGEEKNFFIRNIQILHFKLLPFVLQITLTLKQLTAALRTWLLSCYNRHAISKLLFLWLSFFGVVPMNM